MGLTLSHDCRGGIKMIQETRDAGLEKRGPKALYPCRAITTMIHSVWKCPEHVTRGT